MTRNLKYQGPDEGTSTLLPVHAEKLFATGIGPVAACWCAIARALTDDADTLWAVDELSAPLF